MQDGTGANHPPETTGQAPVGPETREPSGPATGTLEALRLDRRTLQITLAVALVVFVLVLADVLAHGLLTRLDRIVALEAYQRFSGTTRAFFDGGLAAPGDDPVVFGVAGVTIVALFVLRDRTRAAWLAVSTVATALIVLAAKFAVGRQRPAEIYRSEELHLFALDLIDRNPAFPSGHTSDALAIYGLVFVAVLGHIGRTEGPLPRGALRMVLATWVFVALLVGLARMFAGVHHLTDVLGGWSLGLVLLSGAVLLLDRLERSESWTGPGGASNDTP